MSDPTARLRDDLAAVLRDAEALVNASADQGGEKMAAARAKIRESIEAAKSRVRDVERSAREQGEAALHSTEDYVRKNPWPAVGIAAGVGVVIGILLARR